MRKSILFVSIVCLCAALAVQAADEPKLTAEELVAKHLAAIGSPEARAAAKSRGVDGGAKFEFLSAGGAGQSLGSMKLATEGNKLRLAVNLNTSNYTGEDFISDGSRVSIAGFVSGKKSMLGAFVDQRSELLKEGLFGGVLSTGWSLLNVADRKAKLKYNGLKKVGDKELMELKYEPKKSSDNIQIRLYFDPVTYRHVMTIYEALIPVTAARSINPNSRVATNGAQSQEGHQLLKETFGNFKALDGITLPSSWTIQLTNDVDVSTSMKWEFDIRSAVHAPVDPAAFKMK
jgi:hypothetical protein